jgi:predicted RNase H-like nuclease
MIKLLEDTLLCHATEELLEANTTSLVAGADGCPAGWFVVIRDLGTGETSHHTVSGFAGLLDLCAWVKVLAVDIPIGLPESVSEGGRPVDRLARKRLQPHLAASVFPAPGRSK